MATPLSADRLVAALKAEGVKVAEHAGWRTHNRNSKGSWSNLNGIVIHHTAGANSLALCWSGTGDLPGPLCHNHLAKNGTATMVGYGRANHAGTFAANAFNAMLNEASTHPRPDVAEPIDANARTYGIEIENLGNGRDPYPAAQYDAAVRWAAALCRAHGWSANSVIGHKEGTRRKIDPSFDMNAFRDKVNERLEHPASWNPNDNTQEDDMPTANEIAAAVLKLDGIITVPGAPASNPTWTLSSVQTEILKRVDKANLQLAATNAAITKLASLAGKDVDTAAVVAAVEKAIEDAVEKNIKDAVVKVDVDITGTDSKES